MLEMSAKRFLRSGDFRAAVDDAPLCQTQSQWLIAAYFHAELVATVDGG